MPSCPSCRRPVAVARASCLYCGAPLPAAVADEARSAARAATSPAPARLPAAELEAPVRTLVVIDLASAEASALARATVISAYEATLLIRRRGLHLHRVLPPEQAEREAARLAAAGFAPLLVPESEARLRPLRATAGELAPAGLLLRTEEGSLELARRELLMVVTGPIARQRQASGKPSKVVLATLEESWCVHLHRVADPRPIEIDAGSFEPGFAPTGSTELELRAWLDVLAQSATRDDGFRLLTPALAPAEAPVPGALSAVESLRARRPAAADPRLVGERRPSSGTAEERVLLDNRAQFRFYSGWHAAAERRRRQAAAAAGAPPSD